MAVRRGGCCREIDILSNNTFIKEAVLRQLAAVKRFNK